MSRLPAKEGSRRSAVMHAGAQPPAPRSTGKIRLASADDRLDLLPERCPVTAPFPTKRKRSAPTRILVADSPELNRKALTALLQTQSDFQVVGEARDAQEAVGACRTRRHDVVILDTKLPSDREPALRILHRFCPAARILAIVGDRGQRCTMSPTPDTGNGSGDRFPCCPHLDCLGQAIVDGAQCVLTRSTDHHSLFQSVRSVSSARPCLGSDAVQRMVQCVTRNRGADLEQALTERERQVAILIAEGRCNKEIGDRLCIRVTTVKKHIGHILAKWHLQDRLQVGLSVSRAPWLLEGRPRPTPRRHRSQRSS